MFWDMALLQLRKNGLGFELFEQFFFAMFLLLEFLCMLLLQQLLDFHAGAHRLPECRVRFLKHFVRLFEGFLFFHESHIQLFASGVHVRFEGSEVLDAIEFDSFLASRFFFQARVFCVDFFGHLACESFQQGGSLQDRLLCGLQPCLRFAQSAFGTFLAQAADSQQVDEDALTRHEAQASPLVSARSPMSAKRSWSVCSKEEISPPCCCKKARKASIFSMAASVVASPPA